MYPVPDVETFILFGMRAMAARQHHIWLQMETMFIVSVAIMAQIREQLFPWKVGARTLLLRRRARTSSRDDRR